MMAAGSSSQHMGPVHPKSRTRAFQLPGVRPALDTVTRPQRMGQEKQPLVW